MLKYCFRVEHLWYINNHVLYCKHIFMYISACYMLHALVKLIINAFLYHTPNNLGGTRSEMYRYELKMPVY